MKIQSFLVALLIMTAGLSQKVMAADWYAFCYGKTASKTICSPIIPRPANVALYCKDWALGHGANMWGNHTATSTSMLTSKQAAKCDEILGGGSTTSYQCFVEVLCPGGDSSSIRLDPVGGSVSADNHHEAAKKCVSTYSGTYLASLKDNVGMGCYIQAKAME